MTRKLVEPSRKGMQMIASDASAPIDPIMDWSQINWDKCNEMVKRLQARIVKAIQVGRWGKVRALQWLLTHSFSGKALAVKRVSENKGKRTPGIDGITWNTPENKLQAIKSMRRRGYHPLPLKRVYIPKAYKKKRALGIPVMKDRGYQALHLLALEPISETTADSHSYGFRPLRCSADAIGQCFILLSRKDSAQWILEADIKSCFDQIAHNWMLSNIPMDTQILQKWLKAGYVEDHKLFPTEIGTPQGGIISPTAANMTLDGMQIMLERASKKLTGKGRSARINLVRYADDFIITGSSRELLENEVKPLIEKFLAERGLQLSPEKTKITHIKEGFDFLGQNIRKYGNKLLIKPSKKNVSAFLKKIRETVKRNKQAKQIDLIRQLNPIIRGWANYHQSIVAKDTFNRVDKAIWDMTWKWCRRRHRKKDGRWIKNKYYPSFKTQNWRFSAKTEDQKQKDGQPKRLHLLAACDTPIRRHCKIHAKSNPYDSKWEHYFEQRLSKRLSGTHKGNKQLIGMWMKQEYICELCNQELSVHSKWEIHHLIPLTKGGTNKVSNMILVHPHCHKNVHNPEIYE